MPHISFVDEVYKNYIDFAWNESDDKLIKLINKGMGQEVANLEQLESSIGRFYYGDQQYFIVLRKLAMPRYKLAGLLAHECFHCTSRVLRSAGLSLSAKSEEAYSYYLQWIYGKCYKAMYGKK